MEMDEPAAAREAYGLALRNEKNAQQVRIVQRKISDALSAMSKGDEESVDPSNSEMAELVDPRRSFRLEAERLENQSTGNPAAAFTAMSQAATNWIKAEEPERAAAALKKASAAVRLIKHHSVEREHVSLAELYQQIDRHKEAVKHFTEALKLCQSEYSIEEYQTNIRSLMSRDNSFRFPADSKKLLDPNYKYRVKARASEQKQPTSAFSQTMTLIKAADYWSQAGDADDVKRVGASAEAAMKRIAGVHGSKEKFHADLAKAYARVHLHESAIRNYVDAIIHADRDNDAIEYHRLAKLIAEGHGLELPRLDPRAVARFNPSIRYRLQAEEHEMNARSRTTPPTAAMQFWMQAAETWLNAGETENAIRAADSYVMLLEKHPRSPVDHYFIKIGELYVQIGDKQRAIKAFEKAVAESTNDGQKIQYQQRIDSLQ